MEQEASAAGTKGTPQTPSWVNVGWLRGGRAKLGKGPQPSRSRVPEGKPRSTFRVPANSRLAAFAYRPRCGVLSTGFGETHKCALPSQSGLARSSRATLPGGFFLSWANLTYATNKNGAPGIPERRFAQLVAVLDDHGLTPSWTKVRTLLVPDPSRPHRGFAR